MRTLLSVIPALALVASASVWAGQCPADMKAIDAKLSSASLSKEQADEVKKLRAEGEASHKAGKHAESMESLGKAKKILGI